MAARTSASAGCAARSASLVPRAAKLHSPRKLPRPAGGQGTTSPAVASSAYSSPTLLPACAHLPAVSQHPLWLHAPAAHVCTAVWHADSAPSGLRDPGETASMEQRCLTVRSFLAGAFLAPFSFPASLAAAGAFFPAAAFSGFCLPSLTAGFGWNLCSASAISCAACKGNR
jgi:hypothetical protein